jgi:hypothetical protein
VGPITEGIDDGKEFPVVDFVVHFCRGQGFGVIADGAQLLRHSRVLLPKACS